MQIANASLRSLTPLTIGEKIAPFLLIAIHFSTTATWILSLVLVLLWLCSGEVLHFFQPVRQIPAIAWGLILFVLLLVSVSYTSAPLKEAFSDLGKYRKLVLLPILIPFLRSEQTRKQCEYVLIAALVFALFASFIGKSGLIPKALSKTLLKNHITHSLFMAFLAYYCLHALYAKSRYAVAWGVLLLLAVVNLFVIAEGRTGLLAFLILCVMFFIQVFSFKLAALLTSAIAGAFGLFLLFSSHADYVIQGFTETLAFFQQNQPANTTSSMGLRLHFWQSAWMMVAQAPWFGHGIGSFPYEYQKLFPTMQPVFNPHNEYLLLATQLGLTGLLVFLGFIGMLIRQTLQVQGRDEQLLQGVLVIFIVSCLFNSSLFDHSEGYWLIFLVALFSSHLQKCEQG